MGVRPHAYRARVSLRAQKESYVKYVLFVCNHNAGRSQMAQALFERHAPDDVRAESAGSDPAKQLWPTVVEAMRELDIDLSGRRPRKLTVEMQLHADWAVTMGCGDACPYVPTRVEDWDIPDPAGEPMEVVREIRDEIEQRVRDADRGPPARHPLRPHVAPASPGPVVARPRQGVPGGQVRRRDTRVRRRDPRGLPGSACAFVRDDNRPQAHATVSGGGPVRSACHRLAATCASRSRTSLTGWIYATQSYSGCWPAWGCR